MRDTSERKKTWKPVMAGILDIASGIIIMFISIYLVIMSQLFLWIHKNLNLNTTVINLDQVKYYIEKYEIFPIIFVIIGIIPIIGGVYSLQRRIWSFALIGSIFSLLFPFFGIPSLIITCFAQKEFI